MATYINVETDLTLARGAAAASVNSVALNAALRNVGNKAPYFFPEGDWYFGEDTTTAGANGLCVLVPQKSGFAFFGSGAYRPANEGSGFTGPNARILYGGPKVDLASTTHSVTGASATITITSGYTVKSQDVDATVQITGGTNAVLSDNDGDGADDPSWFRIASVDTGTNSWTLDRNCTIGSSTNLIGLMTYTLWRDPGYGNFYQGLAFKGHSTYLGTPRAHVGMHVVSEPEPSGGIGSGKHIYFACSWSDFNVCHLAGKHMEKAYGRFEDYDGETNDHADHLTFLCCNAQSALTFFLIRNTQSVNHAIRDSHQMINITDSVVYAERGGKMLIDNMAIGGSRNHTLRVGIATSNNGQFVIRRLTQDGNPNTAIPRLYKKDQSGNTTVFNRVTFDEVHIASNLNAWSVPLIECYSADRLTLKNVERIRSGDIKMEKGGSSYVPFVVVEKAMLENITTDPSELKNSGSSSPYGTLKWRDCSNFNNSTIFPDGMIPFYVPVGGASLTITQRAHEGRIVQLNYTAAASTCTLPDATGSGAMFRFVVTAVNVNGHIIKVPDANNVMRGSVNILDADSTPQAAYAATGTDDTLTLNGTTKGGQIGDWVEFLDLAADTWMVRGQMVVPSGSNIADPFSATV